ncbi:hypothetical protein ABZ863_29510 [Saccharomonospora sp. NPDC046836]|uniref:hypothetical protein n=1 Tax=Saccharomonospora sp. NPDC046836 TaxID=3156921 RepID=UPI0033F880CD
MYFSRSEISAHGIPTARRLDTIEDVLAEADFVTPHVPGEGNRRVLANLEAFLAGEDPPDWACGPLKEVVTT